MNPVWYCCVRLSLLVVLLARKTSCLLRTFPLYTKRGCPIFVLGTWDIAHWNDCLSISAHCNIDPRIFQCIAHTPTVLPPLVSSVLGKLKPTVLTTTRQLWQLIDAF